MSRDGRRACWLSLPWPTASWRGATRRAPPPPDSRAAAFERTRRYLAQYATPRNYALIDRFTEFARARGHTLADLAIAWVLTEPVVSTVLCGASSVEQRRPTPGRRPGSSRRKTRPRSDRFWRGRVAAQGLRVAASYLEGLGSAGRPGRVSLFIALVLPGQSARARMEIQGAGRRICPSSYSPATSTAWRKPMARQGDEPMCGRALPSTWCGRWSTGVPVHSISWVLTGRGPGVALWQRANLAPVLGALFDYLENIVPPRW